MLKTAPKPVDVQELQFKLRCRLKVFDSTESKTHFSRHCSLVASASRFGLIFIGTTSASIQVVKVKDIEEYNKTDGDKSDYVRRNFQLASQPTHLSVNCEHTLLAIVVEKSGCPCAVFYDVNTFWQKDVIQVGEVRLSPTPGVNVIEVNWNPTLGSLFTACKSDGSLGVYEIKNSGIEINELPAAAEATCFCWSPKGKQIAVGSRDGKITQYKPDLKAVKVINPPPLKESCMLLSLHWVSNYQFIGVFQPVKTDSLTNFIVIDAPKAGECVYTMYEDICYSNGNSRPAQFYLIYLQNWNIMLAASSNSMEVGILTNSGDCWLQWIMGDAARAELPLDSNYQETLPIGCAVDFASVQSVPWGESTLPPAPILLLLSDHGMLCCFNILNLKEGIPTLCAPPDPIRDTSGLQQFVAVDIHPKSSKGVISKESNNVDVGKPFQSVPNTQVQVPNTSPVTSKVHSNIFGIQQDVNPSLNPSTNVSQNQPVNLFGGQITLTQVSQNKTAQGSFSSKYQSLFPVSMDHKVTNPSVIEITSPSVEATLPSVIQVSLPVSSSPVSSANVPRATSSNVQLTSIPVAKLSLPETCEEFGNADIVNVDLKAEEETEKIFSQMLKEECFFLESELRVVLHQGKSFKLDLGTDDDKIKIVESTTFLEEFFKEVVEICTTQNAEIHILKQNLLQSWAWYEEVKSRHLASENESMLLIIQSQPLDPASEKQLADIQHASYYIESQVTQAHLALDEQWENFQDYCKKTRKIQIPTMEIIFQTMVKQNAILRKQSYILKDIASRIKSKSRSSIGPPLLISVDDTKDFTEEFKLLRLEPEDIYQIQYEHVVKRMKNFTQKKVETMRTFLKKRGYSRISALKPQLSSSVIQASPSSRFKQISMSTRKTPLVLKELPSKKLDFPQSTSKPSIQTITAASSESKPSTPIEGLQNFALKFEARNFTDLSDKTFTPLTKGLMSGYSNSAFVLTSAGSNSSVLTSSLSVPFKPSFISVSAPSTTTASTVTANTSSNKIIQSYVVPTTIIDKNDAVTTISTKGVSKPFSFSSVPAQAGLPQKNLSSTPKPNNNIFSTATAKAAFTFNSQNVSSTASPTFGVTDVKSVETVKATPVVVTTTKSLSFSNFTTTQTTKTNDYLLTNAPSTKASHSPTVSISTAKNISNSSGSAVTAGNPFSFGGSTTTSVKVFGDPAQKSTETSSTNATLKPLTFLSKSSVVTTPNLTVSTTANKTQLSNFSVTSTVSGTATKVVSSSQSVVSTSSIITSSSKPANTSVSSPSIFTQPSIFSTGSGVKSNIFSPVAPLQTTNSSSVSSVIATTSATPFATTNTTVPSSTIGTNASIIVDQTASTKPSILGPAVDTSVTTANSTVSSSTIGTNASIFRDQTASTKPSIFGLPVNTSVTTANSAVSSSATGTSASIFGDQTASTKPSIFGPAVNTTQSSVFYPTTTATSFSFSGTSTSKPSIFGNSDTNTSKPSLFANSSSIISTTTSFGVSNTTITQSSVFGNSSSTSVPSVFGTSSPTATQTVFGPSTNETSVFGSPVTAPTSQSIFGSPAPPSQSTSFASFGEAAQKTSIFGSAATINPTQSSIFGNTNQSIFGNAPSGTGSVFGQSQATNTFGQSSVFGSANNSFGNTTVFGTTAPSFGSSAGSIFGNAPTSSGSIFGGTPTTGSTFAGSPSIFGAPASTASSPFGTSNAFSSNTSQSSAFAGNANTGFGFGSLSVGSTPTTSAFGTASNPFENKSIFGNTNSSSSGSIFGSNTGSAFGSSSQSFAGGFGAQTTFGQPSTFGQSTFGSSNFGQQSPGPFSGGSSASVGQTGFGASPTFQKPGFGSPPVFGGSPSFGSSPTFGGAPSFGSSPTFGNSSKVFGSGNSTFGSGGSTFGSTTNSQNAGFGNLASQPTVGFGNLAQQAANASSSNTPFSGNSSFSSWR